MKKIKKTPALIPQSRKFIVPTVLGVAALIGVFAFSSSDSAIRGFLNSASVVGATSQIGLIVSGTEAPVVPESSIIQVSDNTPTSDVELLKFRLTSTASEEITITRLPITLYTSDNALSDVVSKITIETDERDEFSKSVTGTSNNGIVSFFERPFEIVVEPGDSVDVTVYANIKQRSAYSRGTTIRAGLTSGNVQSIQARDGANIAVARYGQVNGNTMALYENGLMVDFVSSNHEFSYIGPGMNDDLVTFELAFSATAFGDDIYIPKTLSLSPAVLTSNTIRIENQNRAWLPLGTPGISYTFYAENGGDMLSPSGKNFHIAEGETEEFTAVLVIDNSVMKRPGQYRMMVPKIMWSETDGVVYSPITFGLGDLATQYIPVY